MAPDICAGLEDIGFGQFGVADPFQVLFKKWKHDVFAIVIAGVGGKTDAAQMIAFVAAPAAMHPGTYHQGIEDFRVVAIDGVEKSERALQIFRIKPAADGEHRAMNIFDVVARLRAFQ